MKPDTLFAERKLAVHLMRKGEKVTDVATQLERSEKWVRKWWKRYCQEGYHGLQDRSRAPKNHGRTLPAEVVKKVVSANKRCARLLPEGVPYVASNINPNPD